MQPLWTRFKFRGSRLFYTLGKKNNSVSRHLGSKMYPTYPARIWWPWLRAPCDPAPAGRRSPRQWGSWQWRWGTALHWRWWSKERVARDGRQSSNTEQKNSNCGVFLFLRSQEEGIFKCIIYIKMHLAYIFGISVSRSKVADDWLSHYFDIMFIYCQYVASC